MTGAEAHYDAIAEEYRKEAPMDEVPEEIFKQFERMVDSTGSNRILDAGCGPGRHAAYFDGEGYEVDGVDISDQMIEEAREHFPGPAYRTGDLTDLPYEDDAFGGIWCSSTIYLLEPDEMGEALSELHRVLVDGGVLYVNFRIGDGTQVDEEWGDRVTKYRVSGEKAESLLKEAGFSVEQEKSSVTTVENPETAEESTFGIYFCRA